MYPDNSLFLQKGITDNESKSSYKIAKGKGYTYVITLPLFVAHLVIVWKRKDSGLDAMVPMLSISTFLLSVLTFIR